MPLNGAGPASITRVRYREHETLTTADLRAEQQYLVAMRRRHHIGLHAWGIVEGLGLEIVAGRLLVRPGVAVDGYGRELVVPDQVVVSGDLLNQLGDHLSVWLLYGLYKHSSQLSAKRDDGACQANRLHEQARIRIAEGSNDISPRAPGEVPAFDLGFTPDRPPPDHPQQEWPVFLGTLGRGGANSPYSVNLADRPYVNLIGEIMVAASSRAQMKLGSEIPGDPRRFSVSVAGEKEALTERLLIDANNQATIFGNAVFGSDLEIADSMSGRTTKAWAASFDAKSAPPETASPWSIYRTLVPTQSGPPLDQLRLEIGAPGDKADPRNFSFSIGRSPQQEFSGCLSITADCAVSVRGKLSIGGQLIEGPIQADLQDPRFAAALIGSWTSGIVTAGAQLGIIAATNLQASIRAPASLVTNIPLTYSIELENVGRGTITDLHVYETLAEGSAVLQRGEVPLQKLTLGESEQFSVARSRDIRTSARGEVDIAVTAIGIGPAGNPIQAIARAKVVVTTPIS